MNPFYAPLNETFTIVGACINCTASANLMATLALILVGVALTARFERRRSA
jgi:hypothetical protein